MSALKERTICLGYWNADGIAVAIVAVANYFNGELFDWTAYIGGTTKTEHEKDACEHVAKHGCKLTSSIARFFALRQTLKLDIAKYRD